MATWESYQDAAFTVQFTFSANCFVPCTRHRPCERLLYDFYTFQLVFLSVFQLFAHHTSLAGVIKHKPDGKWGHACMLTHTLFRSFYLHLISHFLLITPLSCSKHKHLFFLRLQAHGWYLFMLMVLIGIGHIERLMKVITNTKLGGNFSRNLKIECYGFLK